MAALDRRSLGHYVYWSPRLLIIRMSTSNEGVDAGDGRAYKRGPSWGEPFGGMLIEIVEKREGMRGRRPRVAICSCICERLEALDLGPSERMGLG